MKAQPNRSTRPSPGSCVRPVCSVASPLAVAISIAATLALGAAPLVAGQTADGTRINQLIDALLGGDELEARTAGRELIALGAAAVPALVDRTLDIDYASSNYAPTVVLMMIGDPAAPALIEALARAESPRVRKHAADGLAASETVPTSRSPALTPIVVDALINGLSDPIAAVRTAALSSLRSYGPRASKATCAIASLLANSTSHSDSMMVQEAIWTLGDIGDHSCNAVSVLISTFPEVNGGSAGAYSPCTASWSLGKFGAPAIHQLSTVLLTSAAAQVRACAADALGEMKAQANDEAVMALAGALSDRGPFVGTRAAEALASIGKAAHPAVPALRSALNSHTDEAARAEAAEALGEMGEFAIPAIPDLATKSTGTAFLVVRRGALRALGALGSSASPQSSLAKALEAPAVIQAVMSATMVAELQEEAYFAWGSIAFDINDTLLTTATGGEAGSEHARRAVAAILARLLRDDPSTISDRALRRSIGAATASIAALQNRTDTLTLNGLQTALVGLQRERDRRRVRTIGIWSASLLGVAALALVVVGSRTFHRTILILIGRRWVFQTKDADYVVSVRSFPEFVRVELASLEAAEPREVVATLPVEADAQSFCADIRRNVTPGSTVRVRVDAPLFAEPWARYIGDPWSTESPVTIAGQVAALTSTLLGPAHFTKHVRVSTLGSARPGRGLSALPNVQLELVGVGARFKSWGATVDYRLDATAEDFLNALRNSDLVHVAAHATLDGIEFTDRRLCIADVPSSLLAGARCRLLTLSACNAGSITPAASSLTLALVSSGINVIAARVEVDTVVCRAFLEELYAALLPWRKARGIILSDAIRIAVERCRSRFSMFGQGQWQKTVDAFVLFGDPTLHLAFRNHSRRGHSATFTFREQTDQLAAD